MNPFQLTATGLLVWGIVAHLVADWLLQSEWMAANKAKRRRTGLWWDRHPAAYVHAAIHGLCLAPVFGWPAAVIAVTHLVIDTRWLVERWSRLMRQTQPRGARAVEDYAASPEGRPYRMEFDELAMKVRQTPGLTSQQISERLRVLGASGGPIVPHRPDPTGQEALEKVDRLARDMREWTVPVYDMGTEVRLWVDQVFHIVVIAVAALVVVV